MDYLIDKQVLPRNYIASKACKMCTCWSFWQTEIFLANKDVWRCGYALTERIFPSCLRCCPLSIVALYRVTFLPPSWLVLVCSCQKSAVLGCSILHLGYFTIERGPVPLHHFQVGQVAQICWCCHLDRSNLADLLSVNHGQKTSQSRK